MCKPARSGHFDRAVPGNRGVWRRTLNAYFESVRSHLMLPPPKRGPKRRFFCTASTDPQASPSLRRPSSAAQKIVNAYRPSPWLRTVQNGPRNRAQPAPSPRTSARNAVSGHVSVHLDVGRAQTVDSQSDVCAERARPLSHPSTRHALPDYAGLAPRASKLPKS